MNICDYTTLINSIGSKIMNCTKIMVIKYCYFIRYEYNYTSLYNFNFNEFISITY